MTFFRRAILATSITLAVAHTAAAVHYRFVPIADTSSGFQSPLASISMNSNGDVAFVAELNGEKGVFVGDGNSTTTIIDVNEHFSDFGGTPFIDNDNRVLFFGTHAFLSGQFLIDNNGEMDQIGEEFINPSEFSMGQSGDIFVTINWREPNSRRELLVGDGNAWESVFMVDNASFFTSLAGQPRVNTHGQIAFALQDRLGSRHIMLHDLETQSSTTIAMGPRVSFRDLSNDGHILYESSIRSELGDFLGTEVFIWQDGTATELEVDVPDLRRINALAINASGDVLIQEQTATSNRLFIGGDPDSGKVVAAGDELLGTTVADFVVTDNFNDRGQIALWMQFNDGTTGIYRADPLFGDYNDNGSIEQGDLDLVLLNWGQPADPLPDGWTGLPPEDVVDQNELDQVLLSWGLAAGSGSGPVVAAVPDPNSIILAMFVCVLVMQRKMLSRYRFVAVAMLFASLATSTAFCQPVIWNPESGGNGHAYEYVQDNAPWDEARDLAMQRTPPEGFANGHLVTIASREEDQFLFETFGTKPRAAWIGFTDLAIEGEWTWIDETPGIWQDPDNFAQPIQTAYTNWREDEPNDFMFGEDFALIYVDREGAWNDGSLVPFPYIVEWEPTNMPTGALEGDYDGNGDVSQLDLDLVLIFWGEHSDSFPLFTNVRDIPSGAVDQDELDKVLLNWGATSAGGVNAVPEASSQSILAFAALAVALASRKVRMRGIIAAFMVVCSATAIAEIRTIAFSGQPIDQNTSFNQVGRLPGQAAMQDVAGNNLFAFYLSGTGISISNDNGLWIDQGDAPQVIAREATTPPDFPESFRFIEPLEEGVIIETNGSELWHANAAGIERIVGRGDLAPGTNESFNREVVADFASNGLFAFQSGVPSPNEFDVGAWADRGTGLELVALPGVPVPDGSGETFDGGIGVPKINAAGNLAFTAAAAGVTSIWTARDGTFGPIVAIGDPVSDQPNSATFGSFSQLRLNEKDTVAFSATLVGDDVHTFNLRSIWRSSDDSVSLVVRQDQLFAVDGAAELHWVDFSDRETLLNDADQIAFTASVRGQGINSSNDKGIWVDEHGWLNRIVSEGDQAPGTSPGVLFADFEEFQLNNLGSVVFAATLRGPSVTDENDRGIWIHNNDETSLVVRNGEALEIDGSGFHTVTFAALEHIGIENNDVLFSARFTDGRTGVFEWMMAQPAHAATADFNGDGAVDGSDLLDLLVGFGKPDNATVADGDANWDGRVNREDLAVWRRQSHALLTHRVPEPSSLVLSALLLVSVNHVTVRAC